MTQKSIFNKNLQFLLGSQKSMLLKVPGEKSREITLDGPISKEYQNASPRIMWVLKEPHNEGGGSIIEFINGDFVLENGDLYPHWATTYSTLIKVSKVLLEPILDANTIINEHPFKNKNCLQKVALINLNKFGGGNRQSKHYNEGVEKCCDLVRQQIQMLEPQIIICGSTFAALAKILEITIDKQIPVWPSRSKFPSFVQGNRTYISAYHTAQTVLKQGKFLESVLNALHHPHHI